MAGETREIRRDIAETRQEIDEHLQQLGGQVRGELNVERQVRQNLPQVIGGAAILGLALGLLSGRGGRAHVHRELTREQSRLAREWKRLAQERGRLQGAAGLAEIEERPEPLDMY